MPRLSIIIVSYKCRQLLGFCLEALKTASHDLNVEIIVVDNASGDGTIEYLQEHYQEVQLIENDENKGFAYANNIGIKRASSNNILLLNPDTLVFSSSLNSALRLLESNTKAGAVGIRMIDGSGTFLPESKRGIPTPWRSFCRFTGLWKIMPKSNLLSGYYWGALNKLSNGPVEILSGAFLLFDRSRLGEEFLLDERFFMFGEDIDFSYRVLKKNFQNQYLGESFIIHFKGESSNSGTEQYQNNFYGAMELFRKKHFPNSGPVFIYKSAINFLRSFRHSQKTQGKISLSFQKELCFVEESIFSTLLNRIPGERKGGGKPWAVFNVASKNLMKEINQALVNGIDGMVFWNPRTREFFLSNGKKVKGQIL